MYWVAKRLTFGLQLNFTWVATFFIKDLNNYFIMITQPIKILFVISATRINKKGLVPIVCRITYLGIRKPFATGLFIKPENWNNSLQKAIPDDTEHKQINTQLSLIKQEINQAFLFLQVQKEQFDVEDIYLKFKGEDIKPANSSDIDHPIPI